jgi:hypothetical protein
MADDQAVTSSDRIAVPVSSGEPVCRLSLVLMLMSTMTIASAVSVSVSPEM